MKVVSASELGAYLYCKRAWSYQKRGLASQNQVALESGSAYHRQHGRKVRLAALLKAAAFLFFLLAAGVLIFLVLR
jgi:hypothetical protein